MKPRRIRLKGQAACYHCIARVVGGEALFGDQEKEVFRRMLRRVAEFSGVEVLTFVVMSNHVHLLVAVPETREVTDVELVGRYRALYRDLRNAPHSPRSDVLAAILEANGEDARQWRQRLTARMHDLSEFMKTLKQRFAAWYNTTHQRFGTLWAERFKSTLVEPSVRALSAVAAYIDLNPVRAGLVDDPGAYRFSGYGEAMGGVGAARAGIARVMGRASGARDWAEASAGYRLLLFGKGVVIKSGRARVAPVRLAEVVASGGTVPIAEALRCRIRFLSQGLVLGSAEFVRKIAVASGAPLPESPTSLAPGELADICALRRPRGSRFA